jgi:hypothetical protein
MNIMVKNDDRTPKPKAPSRTRFEQDNPVFSILMPKELHDAFTTFLQETGQDRKTFMAIALNKQKANHEHISKQGYDK